ncbi:MAG: polysaccharide deacetylase family protein [Rhizobiaceae bacterium]
MNAAAWAPLRQELARWAQADRRPAFWLRDDDAIKPTPPLDRLVSLTERFRAPLVLASIPAYAAQALADRLASHPLVSVAVHGWSHENHAPTGQKKQELGLHRPEGEVLADLRRGLDRIGALFGRQAIPLLVPPWNRIDAALLQALPGLGYHALSAYGPAKPTPLPMINSTVDIMDWHGTRACLPTPVLVEMITTQLRAAFANDEAIGVLTHHLVHDEAAWVFLEKLFETTTVFGVRWSGFKALMARAATRG